MTYDAYQWNINVTIIYNSILTSFVMRNDLSCTSVTVSNYIQAVIVKASA